MIITNGIHSRLVSMQSKSEFNHNNERIIVSENSPENAAKFLAEINETILSRTLHFTNNSGAQISFEIVGRRVLRISSLQNLNAGTVTDGLVGKPLSDTDGLEDVLKLIQDFTTDAEQISVVTSELEMGFGEYLIGLPVADLSKRILGEDYKSEFSEKVFNFAFDVLTQLDNIEAWLIINNGEETMSFGDPEMVSTLEQYVENSIKDAELHLDRLTSTAGERVCTVLGKLAENTSSVICMRTKDEMAFAVIPTSSTGALLSAWKSENKLG